MGCMQKTKFLLDSGDPDEYRKIASLAKENGEELWGGTTNPSLIAKKLSGKKITPQDAYKLQKELVMELFDIVPGAVSAEVYADNKTTANEMIEQGREIATWHERIYVKLPTNLQGLIARTSLRKEGIAINNTLVFSLQQIFAICLYEKLVQKEFSPKQSRWPTFISPFVGRLDDKGENGMDLIKQALTLKQQNNFSPWILESSVRNLAHIKYGNDLGTDIMTAPAKVYQEWFDLTPQQKEDVDLSPLRNLKPLPAWQPDEKLLQITTVNDLMRAIETGTLDISHPLTTSGIEKFASDWKAIIV